MENFEGKIVLLINDANGIYIPKIFAERYPDILTEDQKKDLSDPDNEFYWSTWDDVLDQVQIKNETGEVYNLHQNDDLWAILDGYGFNDQDQLINLKTNEIIIP